MHRAHCILGNPLPEPSPRADGPGSAPEPRPDDRGATLMLAWQGGDEAAFDALVEAYSGQVYALLTRFLGRRHPRREDLVQETFLRLVRAKDRYTVSARFSTWLYTIVWRLCINETERSRSRQELSLDGAGEDGPGFELPEVTTAKLRSTNQSLLTAQGFSSTQGSTSGMP